MNERTGIGQKHQQTLGAVSQHASCVSEEKLVIDSLTPASPDEGIVTYQFADREFCKNKWFFFVKTSLLALI